MGFFNSLNAIALASIAKRIPIPDERIFSLFNRSSHHAMLSLTFRSRKILSVKMYDKVITPALWLVLLIVGIPQLSETVYTPALPEISTALMTTDAMVEYTLTIYLFGLAVGTLFFGRISDYYGRKPFILIGIALFIIGCIGCYLSTSIEMLMCSRFVQAFGGSVGSVLAQAICRDAFHGPALGRAYSTIGSALALFPAIGPVVGGYLSQYFGWPSIFIFLIAFAGIVFIACATQLSETLPKTLRQRTSLLSLSKVLIRDKRVIGFGFIVACTNGVLFSYFAEGPFFFIETLGLSPTSYGNSFIAIAIFTALGGYTSKKLQGYCTSKRIMEYGIFIMLIFTTLSSACVIINAYMPLSRMLMIGMPLGCQMIIHFCICMVTSNALALALIDYKQCIGTASSLFGCFYYALIALVTFGMGTLHNDTLLPMPLYFLSLTLFMYGIMRFLIKDRA